VTAAPLGEVVGETVPQSAPEQDNAQVTPLLAESLVTVAVNWAVVPAGTMAVPTGTTETCIPGTVTVAEADAAALLAEVAETVTTRSPSG
jgi:hypothetical protein